VRYSSIKEVCNSEVKIVSIGSWVVVNGIRFVVTWNLFTIELS
jgi:hypothetical protein